MTQNAAYRDTALPLRTADGRRRLGQIAGWPGVLADRNFLLFWGGQSISKIGNGVYQVGLAWTVYQLTGSTVMMGTVLAANAIPQLVLLLFGGAVADRLSRRSVVLGADSAACLVTMGLALAMATHNLSVPMLIIGALALGVITAFFGPAYSAMNRDLVRERDFRAANAMLSISGNGARILGPAAAGILYALGGAALVFAVDGATFGVAVLAMIFTRLDHATPRARNRGLRQEMATGLSYTARTRWLALILSVSMVVNFACLAPYFVLLPELVRSHHDGVDMLGALTTTQVLACIVAAAVIGKLAAGIPAGRGLLALASAIGAGTLGLGLWASAPLILFLGVALIGLGLSFEVIENTLLQRLVPAELLSRVYSVNMIVSFALLPVGYVLAGWLAHIAGAASVLAVGGAVVVISCGSAALSPALRNLDKVRC